MDELIALVERAEGDLSALTFEEAVQLHAELTAGYTEARAAVENDDQVAALTTVVAAIRRVADFGAGCMAALEYEQAEAEQSEEQRTAALAALDAEVAATLSTEGEGGDAPAGGGDGGDGGEGDEPPAGDEPGDGEGDDDQAGSQQAAARQASAPSLAALSTIQRRQTPAVPRRDGGDTGLARRIVASNTLTEHSPGHVFANAEELGRTLSRLRDDLVVDSPSAKKHVVGRVAINDAPHIVNAADFAGQDVDLIDEAVRRTSAYRAERAEFLAKQTGGNLRRVASGGICAPAQPDYTITIVGDRGTPFVDSLPTINAERPLSYFPWLEVSLNDAAGSRPGARPAKGIDTVTAAQDAAGYGGTNFAGVVTSIPNGGSAYKDCVKIDCPQPVTSVPEATYRCVTIGQFQAMTFKEYVTAFDTTTSIYFDIYRDQRSIAKVVAASKLIHSTDTVWGTARDLLTKIRRLAAMVRSDRHSPGMTFDVRVPAFAAEMLANDIAVSYASGTENLRVSPAQALALFAAEEGIMVGTYNVSAGTTQGGSPTVLPKQAGAGADINDWPEEIRVLMWAEGSVFRTTYGELAFGLRETGMQTNDYSTFEEVFEQTSTRGSDIFTIDMASCEAGRQGAALAVVCSGDPEEA